MTTQVPTVPAYTGPIADLNDPSTFNADAEEQFTYIATMQPDLNTSIEAINTLGDEVEAIGDIAASNAVIAVAAAQTAEQVVIGDYLDGNLTFNLRGEVVDYVANGYLYKPKSTVSLPYTTNISTYPIPTDDPSLSVILNSNPENALTTKELSLESLLTDTSLVGVDEFITTSEYWSGTGVGGGKYKVVTGNIGDGSIDHNYGSNTLVLVHNGKVLAEQCGVKFEGDRDDLSATYDAGVAINAAISKFSIHSISTNLKGYAGLYTPIIISKPCSINLGGKVWAGETDGHCELVASAFIGAVAIKINAGVRQVTLSDFKLKCYSFGAVDAGIQIGEGYYEDDNFNLNSAITIKNVTVERFDDCYKYYQLFLSYFISCDAVSPAFAGFKAMAGGTSVFWLNCSTYGGTHGFEVADDQINTGFIYSTMINCIPQYTTAAAFKFRNTSMTMVGCGQEFCSGTVIEIVGTGTISIPMIDNLNTNDNKPGTIFHVRPDIAGRSGCGLSLGGMSSTVTGFSGDKVQFMTYDAATPTSILSSAKWTISESCFKSDATSALDRDTWRSGYYYETFIPTSDKLKNVSRYTRTDVSQANITLDDDTEHTIYGKVTTTNGRFSIKLTVTTGPRAYVDVTEVDVTNASVGDVILQSQSPYSMGGVILGGIDVAGETVYCSVVSGILIIRGDTNMTGSFIIERKKYSYDFA